MRHLIVILIVTGMLFVVFSDNTHAEYDSTTGSFLQQDPLGTVPEGYKNTFNSKRQYNDGMNLYEYVKSNPLAGIDPLGLWMVHRDNGPTALAMTLFGVGDTMSTLAKKIGLEGSEFKKWASIVSSKDMYSQSLGLPTSNVVYTKNGPKKLHELTPNTKICAGTVQIPNTVLTYWAGVLGNTGKWWVYWKQDADALKRRGFNTKYADGWSSSAFESYLYSQTASKHLHGIYFWGHGGLYKWTEPYNIFDPFNLFRKGEWGTLVVDVNDHSDYKYNWNLEYKLGLGVLWACGSNAAIIHFSSNSIFRGSENVLVPHGFHLFGEPMNKIIPPGTQGTKQ